ncbi:MAG: tRNA-guanine transglycosylase [Deltaproteobacteria bacterium]|nr:tRNA-guanine transglycosylase [Deltaproteobacteria bacterium]
MSPPVQLVTRRGVVPFPAYLPVTTFGKKYPLDDLVRPYLPRLARGVMVSLHYARQMTAPPRLPLFVDSGGFAAIFQTSVVREEHDLGVLDVHPSEGVMETLTPMSVLDFQEQHADVAFTLDFPIPPGTEPNEAERRLGLTIANARWAASNRRRADLRLYGCVQAWDAESARRCARAYADLGFDGVAIGGLVPRARKLDDVFAIVDAVREELPSSPLHVFGLGNPATVRSLFERGVQSVDSSSYVKLAASGISWGGDGTVVTDMAPPERLRLALSNLALASRATVGLAPRVWLAEPVRSSSPAGAE